MSALCARATGPFHPRTGLPMNTVIVPEAVQPGLKLGTPTPTFGLPRIETSVASAGSLGNAYKGFIRNGKPEQLGNFDLNLPRDRFVDRYHLLGELDDLKRNLDQSGEVNGMSQIDLMF